MKLSHIIRNHNGRLDYKFIGLAILDLIALDLILWFIIYTTIDIYK